MRHHPRGLVRKPLQLCLAPHPYPSPLPSALLPCRLSSSLLAEGATPPDAAAHPLHLGDATGGSELEALRAKLAKLQEPLDSSKEGGPDLASIPPALWTADAAPEVHRQWARLQRSLGMVRPPLVHTAQQPQVAGAMALRSSRAH